MNFGVSMPSLPHVIFSLGTAPEYEPYDVVESEICAKYDQNEVHRIVNLELTPAEIIFSQPGEIGNPLPHVGGVAAREFSLNSDRQIHSGFGHKLALSAYESSTDE